ncbi:TolC family protein [Silvibacterium dinghuense]|uniref:TolC family protein n=2 Tax=Silvibacterium dinghuense TaxID=1560006 RepID=A0A4V1NUY8_9BACT|nr:TolC family protein [Silvibacterium dinghuense]
MKLRNVLFRFLLLSLFSLTLHTAADAQSRMNWDQVKQSFLASNPTLAADESNVQEMKAEEITAYLRPNPQVTFGVDQLYPFYKDPAYQPFSNALTTGSITYLHERDHKRELRQESAQEGTRIASSQHEDLTRNMIFNLRSLFVQTLQDKALVQLSKDELDYYDHIIDISRTRLKDGDLAQIDFDRIVLQRVQYESDLQAAEVSLRTSKIQLLQLLDQRTPIDQFDVDGTFDFTDQLDPVTQFRQIALAERPDLQAAMQSVQQSVTNHKLAVANGSTDPTFGVDAGANPPLDPYVGFNVSIPLRIFDRNQGEKKRTQLDIGRNQQLEDAARAQVFSDVDSAWEQVNSNLILLRPYKAQYLAQAVRVRDTVTYAYQHGGASLMDFLNAQSDYRNVQMAYLQLVGAYLVAAGQLNLAVGREVIQ